MKNLNYVATTNRSSVNTKGDYIDEQAGYRVKIYASSLLKECFIHLSGRIMIRLYGCLRLVCGNIITKVDNK